MVGGSGLSLPRSDRVAVPRDFAWVTNLGAVVSVHRASLLPAAVLAPAFAFAIIVAGFIVGAGLEGPLHLPSWSGLIVAGALWAFALGAVGYWSGSRAGRTVVLYERGLAVKESARVRAWRWEDIDGVSIERTLRRRVIPHEAAGLFLAAIVIARVARIRIGPAAYLEHTLTIHDRAGGSCVIDTWFPGADVIATTVEDEVTRRLAPDVQARYDAGEYVNFGAFELSKTDGLRFPFRAVPWDVVTGFDVQKGVISITLRTDAHATSIAVSQVRNFRILLALLQARIPRARSDPPG